MDRRIILCVSLLIVIGLVFPTAVVCGKKPDKPPGGGGGDDPTPEGTVYYVYNDGTGKSVWKMDADGSPKTEVCTYSAQMESLSRSSHGGHHWFIGFKDISGESYPDGIQRQEIYAIRDDNSKEIQLTNDATLASAESSGRPIWGINDGYISWIAKQWMQTETGWTLGKCGIWKQSIAFDSNGDVTGLTGTPSLAWESTYRYKQSTDQYIPRISWDHDWSPDGKKLVFVFQTTSNDIHVADTTSGTETDIAEGYSPIWSPDGNKIAFSKGGTSINLKVINPDGTGEKTLVQASHKGDWVNQLGEFAWSPDSKFLSYVLSKNTIRHGSVIYKSDMYYIGAEGTGNTLVSKDLNQSGYKFIMGWR
jgi:hypothetical protein